MKQEYFTPTVDITALNVESMIAASGSFENPQPGFDWLW